MIQRPPRVGAFHFVVLAGLRAAQLRRGCLPRVHGMTKIAVIAQSEVAEGKIIQLPDVLIGGIDDPVKTVELVREYEPA